MMCFRTELIALLIASCFAVSIQSAFANNDKSSCISEQGYSKSMGAWIVVTDPLYSKKKKILNGHTSWHIAADKIRKCGESISGSGNVDVFVTGQGAHAWADCFVYNKTSTILELQGNVRIVREGMVTNGAIFKFGVSSPDYLITQSGVSLAPPEIFDRHKVD